VCLGTGVRNKACIGADPVLYVRVERSGTRCFPRKRSGAGCTWEHSGPKELRNIQEQKSPGTKEPRNIQQQRSLGILGNKGPKNTQKQRSLEIFRRKEPRNIQDKGA
jgi:hypothetical protein